MILRRLILAIVLLLGAAQPLLAQTTPRAAAHDDFGRMVFDWSGPVKWSADVADNQLVVRFDKAIAGNPSNLIKPLSRYLKAVTVSGDKRTATFTLARPIQIKTFLSGKSTVIDMSESKDSPSTPPAAPTPVTQAPAAQAPATAAPAAAVANARIPGAPDVNVRGGSHDGFNRLVFDWPKPVGYSVSTPPGQVIISFDRPGNINTKALQAALPADIRLVETRPEGNGTTVVLSAPEGTTAKNFKIGPKVALDLKRPPPGSTPAVATPAQIPAQLPTPAQTAAKGAEPPPAAAAPLPEIANSPLPPRAKPGAPAAPDTAPPLQPVTQPTAGAPAADAAPAAVSLGVGFDQPTSAAAFRRAGWLWLVFDRRTDIDVKLLQKTGGDVVLHVEQVPGVKNGTAVRMITKPGFNPSVRKEGQLWVFDMAERPLAPHFPLLVNRQFDFEERGRLLLPTGDAPAQPVIARDPEVGDTIQVMPLPSIGSGVRDETLVPGAQLLVTAQGVALVPLADGARLEGNRQGVEVTMPGGLHLSKSMPTPEGTLTFDSPAEATVSNPADVSRWNRGGLDKFVPEHQKLLGRMTSVKPEEKEAQRLEIARHFLANGMAGEALGELRIIAAANPAAVETPNFRAVRGIANFMLQRDTDAIDDLSHASLAKDPQAQIWLAAAKARGTGEYARNGLLLRLAPEEVKPLTPRLRMTLGSVAAQSAAAAGDSKAANKIVEAMNGPGLNTRDLDQVSYLQGLAAEAGNQLDQAVSKYREAEDGENRPARAYAARNRIELQLKRKQITRKEAIDQMQKLRFAWRGGDFEYTLLKRLGELMLDDGQYAEGLRLLRSVTANHGDNPDISTVQGMMNDAFEKLYLNGGADGMAPVAAIGLYDEFQELTPSGAKGDEMIRKLADRLAAVDLLDRAAELLRHQVRYRLQGVDKARVGARLAFLELADRKPNQALDSLDASEVPGQPPELYDQRRYLRVRALAELGRAAEALALIVNDQSDTAKQLRTEIYWDLKKWPEAAAALESTIEKPEGNSALMPGTPRRLVDLATAMTLARDERGLQRLRRTYGQHMAKTEFKEAFDLLTSEPERGVIDYRKVSDKIKQVENFRTFMTDWNNRVKTQGLSSVN